jgi:hypothetical protein
MVRALVRRKEKPIVETAYARISPGGAVNGTQGVDPLKDALKHKGIIVKISATAADSHYLIACQ